MQNRTSANIIGPDLNEYRGNVNYSLLATKTNYCYLRASGSGSGKFREDKKFNEYVQGLKSVGIKTGAYHYAVPSYDLSTADEQCDKFIETLEKAYGCGRYGDLFPVIDVEAPTDKSISTDALLNWVDRFRKRFERKTNRVLMLYTGAFFIELYNNFYHSSKGFILSDMPLWIAMYPEVKPNPPYPIDQGGWTRWRMWQYTENGEISGVSPPVDLNYGPTNLDLLMQPRDVRNFNAVGSGRNIRLTWTANTDVDLAGYNIFMNSSYITTLGKNATSYTIELGPQVAPVEKYQLAIEAFDTDGDFSPNLSRATVTFTRNIGLSNEDIRLDKEDNDYNPIIMELNGEVKEDIKDIIDESERQIKIEDADTYNDIAENIENKYIDPVINLEKKIFGNILNKYSYRQKNNEDKGLYEDFVESNDEFDDILYLKKLENEIAYKKYYGDMRGEYQLDFYDTNEDNDEDDDYIYTDYNLEARRNKYRYSDINGKNENNINDKSLNIGEEEYKVQNDEDSYNNMNSNDMKVNNESDLANKEIYSDNNLIDVEKMKLKMKDYDNLKDCDNCKERLEYDNRCSNKSRYKDTYEGERRRLENKDGKKKSLCYDCSDEGEKCNSCEYLIYDMYLNNCDYGYKGHDDKKKYKYKESYEGKHDKKKKKKKHH